MKLLVEATRSAAAQPVATTVVTLIIAGVCAAILATTGQTVRAEQDILARIDAAGTRSVVITDVNGTAAISSAAVERIGRLEGVEWVIGLGPATDVRSVGNQDGSPAALRVIYGGIPPQLQLTQVPKPGEAVVGPRAQRTLGLLLPYGGVVGASDYAVVGGFQAEPPLDFLDRSLVVRSDLPGQVRSIHILVTDPSLVTAVTTAALTLVAPEDPTSIGIETSETLAAVRAAVRGELGSFSRNLITLVLGVGLVLTALSVYGAVTSRRRDFGRRRALGASRLFILGLVTAQTLFAAILGVLIGTGVITVVLGATTGVLPDAEFTTAIGVLAILSALIAALPPALLAAYRDPIRVLRVP